MENIEYWKLKANEFIKDSRYELRLKQKELAEILGVPQANISKYETGKVSPPGYIVLAILDLLRKKSRQKSGIFGGRTVNDEVDELFEIFDTPEWNEAFEFLARN